jgi:hypothetical protein
VAGTPPAGEELARRERCRSRTLSAYERSRLLALGTDLPQVCQVPTTTARDKKKLLRALLDEVIIAVHKDEYRSHLTQRWRGGALAEFDLDLPRRRVAPVRTDEDTVALVRRLAVPIPMPSLPAFSIGNNAPPLTVIASPPTTLAVCVATGTSLPRAASDAARR